MSRASRPAGRGVSAGTPKRPKSPRNSRPDARDEPERQSQFTLQMRESLHQELARRAFDSGMTMRGFIMSALKRAGLKVTEADLIDRRRR